MLPFWTVNNSTTLQNVRLCSLVDVHQRLERMYCFELWRQRVSQGSDQRKQVSSAYNEDKTFLLNVGNFLLDYMASHPRKYYSSQTPLWEPQQFIKVLSGRFIPLKGEGGGGGGGGPNTQRTFNIPHALKCILIRWALQKLFSYHGVWVNPYNVNQSVLIVLSDKCI
jgi:hypothetical protein